MNLLSSAEAAKKLGVHITRVPVLIREGRLPAKLVGRTYVIEEPDLRLVAERKPGRPPRKSVTSDRAEKGEEAEKENRLR